MGSVNWLAVIAATVAGFMVGGLWYSVLFGKVWMAERGVTREEAMAKGANPAKMFGITLLLDLVIAFVLDHVIKDGGSLQMAMMVSGGIALGFVIPTMGVNYLYQQASFRLFLIDASHWLVTLMVMGLVLSLLS